MIYLASPYSGTVWEEENRYEAARAATAALLRQRYWVFSPIVHCHDLAKQEGLPGDAQFWSEYNFHMLERADELYVLTLPGWELSRGVRQEIAHWTIGLQRPEITYLDPAHPDPEKAKVVRFD